MIPGALKRLAAARRTRALQYRQDSRLLVELPWDDADSITWLDWMKRAQLTHGQGQARIDHLIESGWVVKQRITKFPEGDPRAGLHTYCLTRVGCDEAERRLGW